MNDQHEESGAIPADPGGKEPGRALTRWLALPWNERRWLLGLMLGLPIIAAMVRVFGVFRTRRWLERASRHAGTRDADSADLLAAERVARLAAIAGRRGAITATCLRQALLVYWILRRRGFAPVLRIGMRSQGGQVDGHAWVELQGLALDQPNLSHVPFANSGGARP